MGIKGFKSYLNSQLRLQHIIEFTERDIVQQRKIILWDVLGFMRRLFGCYNRTTKLLSDFKQLEIQTKRTISVFKLYGFTLVAFIDGYHIKQKTAMKMKRTMKKRIRIQKHIELIKKLQNNEMSDKKKKKIINKDIQFVPSSGYKLFLETALKSNGCIVYRGSGKHDIDQDIATYAYLNGDNIYGIISQDTDFFGFYNLPKHIKLIHNYNKKYNHHTKFSELKFTYYNSDQVWNSLCLYTKQQRFRLINMVGNDFIEPKLTKHEIEMQLQLQSNKELLTVSESMVRIDELIKIFDIPFNDDMKYKPFVKIIADAIASNSKQIESRIDDSIHKFYCIRLDCMLSEFKHNVNTTWIDLKYNNVYESGIYVHDIDAVGFTIQDKVTNIRHSIIQKYLNLNEINEWKCTYDKKKKRVIKAHKIIDLTTTNFENITVATPNSLYNNNIYIRCIVMSVLSILKDKNWLTDVQYYALELQFKFRYDLLSIYKHFNEWPFEYKLFKQYKEFGVPRIHDLTAQCLYWELCKWICFNPNNIFPNIYELFDGPLFHFFCHVQINNDKHYVIKNLNEMLKQNPLNKEI